MKRPDTLPEWPEWMDLRTLERYASTSERTIRTWINLEADPLPACRPDGKIMVSRRAFDSWMERRPLKPQTVDVDAAVAEIMRDISA